MAFRDEYSFEDLVNIAEDLVIAELEKQLTNSQPGIEITQDACVDMAAYALNLVKPMYRANLMGRVYAAEFEKRYHQEITSAVAQAILKISADISA